jgi:HemY protein
MFRALWYIFKVMIAVGLSVFLIVQPGQVTIAWKDYNISIQLGYMAVGILVLLFLVASFSEFITRLSLWPQNIVRARAEKKRSKGYRSLMQSLSAAATGDQKNALILAQRAQKFLPEEESGLPLLLQAQALSKNVNAGNIEEPYKLLLKNADTALLGLQGMTQNAILAGDFAKALLLARKAYSENPKNHSLAKAVYDLEIKNRLWNDALITLDKNRKYLRDSDDVDRRAIYIVLGDMAKQEVRMDEAFRFYKKAFDEDKNFVPAATRFIQVLIETNKRSKGLSILQKSWKENPHPAYIPLWSMLVPEQKAGKPNVKFRWFQWIAEFHPESEVAQLALARVAIGEQLWGEARIALAKAEKLGNSAEIYELWVLLEEKTTNKPDVIRQWLDRAYSSKTGGVWVCSKSGRHFPTWQAVIEPEGHFNSLIWNPIGIERSEYSKTYGVLTKQS